MNHCFTTCTGRRSRPSRVKPFTGRICSIVLDKDGGGQVWTANGIFLCKRLDKDKSIKVLTFSSQPQTACFHVVNVKRTAVGNQKCGKLLTNQVVARATRSTFAVLYLLPSCCVRSLVIKGDGTPLLGKRTAELLDVLRVGPKKEEEVYTVTEQRNDVDIRKNILLYSLASGNSMATK